MDVERKWFCTCTGKRIELTYAPVVDEEPGVPGEPAEPICAICGATPSSDPRRTVTYRDVPDWDD